MGCSMKVKLMIAMTSAAVLGMSAFMEPAAARETEGETYSLTGQDQTAVIGQFNLFNTTRDGKPIQDLASENNIGLFRGAIENFILAQNSGEFGELSVPNNNNQVELDSSGNPKFKNPFSGTLMLFEVGNLQAMMVEDNMIEYTIFKQDKKEDPITFSTKYRLDLNQKDTSSAGFFSSAIQNVSFPIDKKRAINDLSYILNNNLLGLTKPVLSETNDTDTLNNLILSKSVPEPSTVVSLLSLGALGAGSMLKRKMKLS